MECWSGPHFILHSRSHSVLDSVFYYPKEFWFKIFHYVASSSCFIPSVIFNIPHNFEAMRI